MWHNGSTRRKQKVFRVFKGCVKKNNMSHQRTLESKMFPQAFPLLKTVGKQITRNDAVIHEGLEPMTCVF